MSQLLIKRQWFITSKHCEITEDYQITIEIGSGGYGKVFLAEHLNSHIIRAVKAISKSSIQNYNSFMNEISILKGLNHPNIVNIIETYETSTICYIVLEYCTGGDLFTHLSKLKTFSEARASKIMKSLLSGLAYCHKHNICHRDLKPENCLFISEDEESDIKIIDFGLSVPVSEEEILHDPQGTPYYIAPEMLAGSYTKVADCWSLGVILYIMLSGVVPFKGSTTNEILMNVYSGEYTFRHKAFKIVSNEAKDLIVRLLTKDPSFRITAPQAFMHSWVQGVSRSNPAEIPGNILASMRNFQRSNSLRQAGFSFIASKLNEESISKIKLVFQDIDVNGDGEISLAEFIRGVKDPVGLGSTSLEAICRSLDTDNNGVIDYNEFLAACILRPSFSKEDFIKSAFDYFDRDSNGFITSSDLKEALTGGDLTISISKSHLETLIAQCDQNADGKIDYKEFVDLLRI